MHMELSRREFLKGAVGVVLLASAQATAQGQRGEGRRWAMYIDVAKCYGCYACVTACAAENNVPIGVFRTWIERVVKEDGTVVFVPKQCNHCENPPCVKPCPTGATYKTDDGLVLVNDALCIGCGACVKACPYGARFMDPVKGTANKCTFCDHRIYNGTLPACVEACPTGARVFGDLNDPNSEVSKYVRGGQVQVWKPAYGTEPQIYYNGLPREVEA